MDKAKAITN